MSWFTYKLGTADEQAPVRRRISFPFLQETLEENDWVQVNIGEIDIGRVFFLENGLIKNKADFDSYLVVYQDSTSYYPTYSLIVETEIDEELKKFLWFKSVKNFEEGTVPDGSYYLYYHKDNIQYIEDQEGVWTSFTPTSPVSGYVASETGSEDSTINRYSTNVFSNEENNRVAGFAYMGDIRDWSNGYSSIPGAKLSGPFSGPRLRIYADKTSKSGKIKINVVKTSTHGSGQQNVRSEIVVDLYSSNTQLDQVIYSLDLENDEEFIDYKDLYGNFSFEIEILSDKNNASQGNDCKITRYTFSNNYNIRLMEEEFNPEISFKSSGGVR